MAEDFNEQLPESINVVSPCIGVCHFNDAGDYCMGCHRTTAEIGAWRMADLEGKAKILCRAYMRWKQDGAPDPDDKLAQLNHAEMAERFRLMGFQA
jgi:predicted Fe-S protein YdhL (DUF1289 family)